MKRVISIFIFLFVCLFSVACQASNENDSQTDHLLIYTSIYPIYFVTEQIAKDQASIESVYPPGVDAHTYEPTSKEVTAMAKSDAFIYLGAGMESFAETAANTLESHEVSTIELGEHENLFNGNNHNDRDPHIWLDPLRMIEMAEIIKNELIDLKPNKSEQFTENFNQLKEDLQHLDQEFLETINDKKDKHILVAHAAYGYWEERYGVEQIAISGLTTGDEPSQSDLTKVVNIAKEKNLKYVIFEQNSSDRVSKIIQEQIHADALHIHNLEVLTDDDIQNDDDYQSLMRKNLEVLDQAIN